MYVKTTKELGVLIHEARRSAGLTQAELASRLGFSQGWISEIEQGKERADIGMVLQAMSILGLRVDVNRDHAVANQTVQVTGLAAAGSVGSVSAGDLEAEPYSLDEIV